MIRYRNPESSPASIRPGRSGLISFRITSSAATDSRPSWRNSGLNPISNGSPGERHGDRLRRLAHVRGLRAHRQLALGEAQPQRRVLLGHQADPAARRERSSSVAMPQFVLERVGQQLVVVRELTIDQARAQDIAPDLEHDLVLAHRNRDLVRVAGEPLELLQRARRDVGLEAGVDGGFQRRDLHRQPIGVGGHHAQLGPAHGDQDAGEDRACLVTRGRALDARDRLDERRRRQPDAVVRRRLRKRREVLRAQRADVERGAAGGDLHVLLGGAQLEHRHRRAACAPRRAAGAPGRTTTPSRSTWASSGTRRPTSMSVARSSTRSAGGVELHAGERLDGAAGGGDAGDGLQVGEQLCC